MFICLQDVVIHSGDEIRLKIVGTRVDASGIVSVDCHFCNRFASKILLVIRPFRKQLIERMINLFFTLSPY